MENLHGSTYRTMIESQELKIGNYSSEIFIPNKKSIYILKYEEVVFFVHFHRSGGRKS